MSEDGQTVIKPSLSGAYLARGHARGMGDHYTAAEFLETVLAASPNDLTMLRHGMIHNIDAVNYARGRMIAQRILTLDPKSPEANIHLATDAILKNEIPAAVNRIDAMSTEGVYRYSRPLLLAWLYRISGNKAAAQKALAPLQNGDIKALFTLHNGMMAELDGNNALAETSYEATLKALPQTPLRILHIIGSYYARHGKIDRARKLYLDFTRNTADSVSGLSLLAELDAPPTQIKIPVASAKDGFTEALYNLAFLLDQNQGYELGLFFAHEALRIKPELDVALSLVSDMLESNERFAQAIIALEQIKPGSPLYWNGRLRIARAYEELGLIDFAIGQLRSMSTERPERIDALMELGGLLRQKDQFVEAAAVYDQAVSRIEKKMQPYHWALFYARGMAYEKSNQWAKAEADFLKSLELLPDQPYVLNYLGYSWVDRNINLDRGLNMVKKAAELRPNDGFIIDSLGWAYYRLNKYPEAVTELERAISLQPRDPTINDHLGDAYWKVGRQREARFQWERALNLDPEADQRSAIEIKLKEGISSVPKKKDNSG
ncbi:MAG: tetratricopeptide repeat protein [Alphaproteobacteria bacterium]